MEMSALRKNNLKQSIGWAVMACTLACTSLARAEIVFLSVGTAQAPSYIASRPGMSSIIMVPVTERATESSYLMQRSLAWQTYQRRDRSTGLPLVYVPSVSGAMSATSPRQANVRENIARANAYRLDYFGKK